MKIRFENTFTFSIDINKFILLLRKSVYSYEFIDDWEKFNGISFHEREEFYSNLNMENITDSDYSPEPDSGGAWGAPPTPFFVITCLFFCCCFFAITLKNYKLCYPKLNRSLVMHH